VRPAVNRLPVQADAAEEFTADALAMGDIANDERTGDSKLDQRNARSDKRNGAHSFEDFSIENCPI
jgi:hypothetical protein